MPNHATPRAPARRPSRTQAVRGPSWLALVGYAGLAAGCLALAVVTFLLVVAPADLLRDRLVEQVKASTGRELAVSGPVSLVLFPRLAVAFGDVTLSAPPGMGGEPTARIERLEAELGLAALFSRRAVPKRLVLTRPVFALRVDGQGRRSWEFALAPARRRLAQAAGAPASDAPQVASAAHGGLAPIGVRILDGTIRYSEERTGLSHEIRSLDAELRPDEAAHALAIEGGFGWNGERVAFAGALSPLASVLQQGRSRLTLRIAARPLRLTYSGALDAAPGLALDGRVGIEAPSLEMLAAWLGKAAASGRELGGLSLAGTLTSTGGRLALADLSGTIAGATLSGELAIDTRGQRPHLGGRLAVSQIDLGRVLLRPAARPAAGLAPSPPAPPPAPGGSAGPGAQPAPPKAPGAATRTGAGTGWSEDVVDLGPLGIADAELALSADRLVYKDVKAGPARLSLRLEDRVARLTLEEIALYGGRGRGLLTLDGSGPMPTTAVSLALERVSALPLLKDAMGFDWLEGQASLTLELAGQGASERQIMEGLNGKAEMTTAAGALNGIDIGKMLSSIEQARFTGLGVGAGERTAFSEFAGSFLVANGIATNQDLRLASPRLRLTGAGSIDLGRRALDYTVNARIVGGAAQPGAVVSIKGLDVPVRIEGPWENLRFGIKGQEQIIDAVKEIGKHIKPEDVEEAIKGIIGGADGQRVKPRELLDRLFKKQ